MSIEKIIFEDEEGLAKALTTVRRAYQHFTLESSTTPKHNVKSRATKVPFNEAFPSEVIITKKEYTSLFLNYAKKRNQILESQGKDPDFVSMGLKPCFRWVEGAEGLIFEHIDKEIMYLRHYLKFNANHKSSEYIYHFEDGTELTDEQKNDFFTNYMAAKKKNEVEVRGPKFSNLTRMVVDGKIIIRKGYETKEDHDSILIWHIDAEEKANKK